MVPHNSSSLNFALGHRKENGTSEEIGSQQCGMGQVGTSRGQHSARVCWISGHCFRWWGHYHIQAIKDQILLFHLLTFAADMKYLFDYSLPLHCPDLMKELKLLPIYFADNLLQRTPPGTLYHDSWPSLFIAPKGLCSELHVDAFGSNFWMALFEGRKRWMRGWWHRHECTYHTRHIHHTYITHITYITHTSHTCHIHVHHIQITHLHACMFLNEHNDLNGYFIKVQSTVFKF